MYFSLTSHEYVMQQSWFIQLIQIMNCINKLHISEPTFIEFATIFIQIIYSSCLKTFTSVNLRCPDHILLEKNVLQLQVRSDEKFKW